MSLIDSMQILKEDIKSTRQKRKQDLKAIKEDTRKLQQDTHRMVDDAERTRKEEAKTEARKLAASTKDLTEDVAVLCRGFRQDQKEVRKEILSASAVWHGKASVVVDHEKKQKEKNEED